MWALGFSLFQTITRSQQDGELLRREIREESQTIMDTPADPADQALAQLRTDYQGHRIWRATRHDGLLGDWVATLHDPTAGVYPTVVRTSAEDLRKALDVERAKAAEKTTSEPHGWAQW